MTREEIESQAEDLLRQHGKYEVPIDPVDLAATLGVSIFNAKFSDEHTSGVTSRRGEEILILVNESEPSYRKRFTIAHELGHFVLHLKADGELITTNEDLYRVAADGALADSHDQQEVEANQFAAALLMPAPLVRRWYENVTDITTLAKVFNVSEPAMAVRLRTLNLAL